LLLLQILSLEATTAVMGTLTDAGIEASIAGTSLRNIFLKNADPASDLSQHLGFTVNSTEDLEKALVTIK
jgi:TP901 family phage tail tape measure protein